MLRDDPAPPALLHGGAIDALDHQQLRAVAVRGCIEARDELQRPIDLPRVGRNDAFA